MDENIAKMIVIFCDNQSTIKLAGSDAFRPRTKHIDVRFHHIREKIEDGTIKISYIPTGEMAADSLTKPVSGEKHNFCSAKMGLRFVK